jgi:hypothetical protein
MTFSPTGGGAGLGETVDLVITDLIREGDLVQPLKKCQAAYFAFPNDQLSSQYQDDLSKFNTHIQSTPPAGFSMAKILPTVIQSFLVTRKSQELFSTLGRPVE